MAADTPGQPAPQALPRGARFSTARSTLIVDRAMTAFIKVGGITVIVAVLGILVFIAWQVVPLFRKADVAPLATLRFPAGEIAALGMDEWGERPFAAYRDGTIAVYPQAEAGARGMPREAPGATVDVPPAMLVERVLPDGVTATVCEHLPESGRILFGGSDGTGVRARVAFSPVFAADGKRTIDAVVEREDPLRFGNGRVIGLGWGGEGEETLAAAILEDDAAGLPERPARRVVVVGFEAGGGLGAAPEATDPVDITALCPVAPWRILVDVRGESVIVAGAGGDIAYLARTSEGMQPRQLFTAFADQADRRVASVDWLFGDVSLVATNAAGVNRIFSLSYRADGDRRTFSLTKELGALPAGASAYAGSTRNKGFMLASGTTLSLRYGTTAAVRWQGELPFAPAAVALNGKFNRIAAVASDGRAQVLSLHDPHPEAGWRTYFSKVWYEGGSEPEYQWQSTGGSDDFEPKLSMVPLIIGTLKGTFYAMLFAVPIALLGAIYTAEFMHPRFRSVVKPVVEIMASLPSVVLGFLAAVWIAPLLVHRIPSLLLVVIALPLLAIASGWIFARLPRSVRSRLKPGQEFLAVMPVLALGAWAAWTIGPILESVAFRVPDPQDPARSIADFTRWWSAVTGMKYEQRNSIVVGFMMGFAVIPIIFTIAEDALSNVPHSLRSGSLALGASRWQTALRVMVPTASAGIFSALMIGLGRAIGETMIVVMATGNTAIMDFNPFSGMRTLSANIAVELPEASESGTLYRTLFLGALLLFIMTFAVNTVAELLRQHLRDKYKTV